MDNSLRPIDLDIRQRATLHTMAGPEDWTTARIVPVFTTSRYAASVHHRQWYIDIVERCRWRMDEQNEWAHGLRGAVGGYWHPLLTGIRSIWDRGRGCISQGY